MDGKTKIFKLLTDLECEKNDTLHNIAVLESKLIKLEISPKRIDLIESKIRFYHLNLCHGKSKSNLKQYFNNKSLIVYANHVLFMSV